MLKNKNLDQFRVPRLRPLVNHEIPEPIAILPPRVDLDRMYVHFDFARFRPPRPPAPIYDPVEMVDAVVPVPANNVYRAIFRFLCDLHDFHLPGIP